MSLLANSESPVVITELGVEKTYDKWVVTNCLVTLNRGAVSLGLRFNRCRVVDGAVDLCPTGVVNYSIDDILTDSDLSTASISFFNALVSKATDEEIIA